MLRCGMFKYTDIFSTMYYVWYIFGTCLVYAKEIEKFSTFKIYQACTKHVPKIYQFFLNFTSSVHCDHIVWEIVKIFLNDLLQNIMGTFARNFLNIPNNFLAGKLKSHGLVHCKSAEHVLYWGYCRDIGSEYSKYTYNMLVRYVLSILAPVLTMYSACNGSVHHPSPPVKRIVRIVTCRIGTSCWTRRSGWASTTTRSLTPSWRSPCSILPSAHRCCMTTSLV